MTTRRLGRSEMYRRTRCRRRYCALAQSSTHVGDGHEAVDFLSQLPDELLSEILSFLSAEAAVKNKLLSRRWKHLYPSNATLRFHEYRANCSSLVDAWTFVRRVDKTLQQFRPPMIKVMDLRFDFFVTKEYASSVDEWIRRACLMRVERIRLLIDERGSDSSHTSYAFPFHLLHVGQICYLKHLDLEVCSLPPFTSLAGPLVSLRTLRLCHVSFHENGNYEDIPFYFPYLEDLRFLHNEELPDMRHFCGRLYCLKSLVVEYCSRQPDLEIHNANLTKFRYRGNAKNISFEGLNCLQKLDIATDASANCLALFLYNLPKGAPQLESLSIYSYMKEDFQFPISVSTFKCLKCLRLQMSIIGNNDIHHMSRFLHFAPLLQKLIIILCGESEEWSAEWLKEQLVLQQMKNTHSHSQQEDHLYKAWNLHSHLKEVVFGRIDWRRQGFGRKDIELIIALLKSATLLEKMILWTDHPQKVMELQRALTLYKPQVDFVSDEFVPWNYLG